MRKGTQGEGLVFYGPEEATIAYNEKKVDIHAPIKVYVNDIDKEGNPVKKMVETSVGRLMVNEFVPEEVGYINEVLGKKALRDIIGKVIKLVVLPVRLSSWMISRIWVIIWLSKVVCPSTWLTF